MYRVKGLFVCGGCVGSVTGAGCAGVDIDVSAYGIWSWWMGFVVQVTC